MTPEEARAHLAWPEGKDHPKVRDGSGQTWFEVQAGESHPYWNRLPDAPYEDAVMYAVAHDALATIAGMREECGVAVTYPGLAEVVEWGYSTQAGALEEVELASTAFGAEYRIVRRYVTETEEIS